MNVGIGTEAALFLFLEYINGIFNAEKKKYSGIKKFRCFMPKPQSFKNSKQAEANILKGPKYEI
jgi:hypothetical protein